MGMVIQHPLNESLGSTSDIDIELIKSILFKMCYMSVYPCQEHHTLLVKTLASARTCQNTQPPYAQQRTV